jgi:hypothetical protein
VAAAGKMEDRAPAAAEAAATTGVAAQPLATLHPGGGGEAEEAVGEAEEAAQEAARAGALAVAVAAAKGTAPTTKGGNTQAFLLSLIL